MISRFIDNWINIVAGFLALFFTMLIIISVVVSVTGFTKVKQELSAVKRYYLSAIDNANSNEVKSATTEVEKQFDEFNWYFFKAGPVKIEYDTDQDFAGSSQKSPDKGYYGRPLTVRFSREVKFFFNKKPFVISTGASTVNRSVMDPSKSSSIEFRLGKEFE